ncbi:hypothetical protein Btru_033122 [Bulinus truncatus]|nr:hypothetical protein Btru_033122 [Bulinus truncatus]
MAIVVIVRDSIPGDQTFPCPNCGEVFRSKVAVRRHQTYSCTSALTPYSSLKEQMGLAQHGIVGGNGLGTILSGHEANGNNNNNNVSTGGDSDDNRSDDSYQEPVETGNGGEFKCDECPKSFQWKANLQRHQLTHDADRKFPCENCDKVFTDPSNLQRHIRSQHVGARSHACSECGKTFATSSGLKQHQHIHSSVKPFQCEVCLKAYTQFSNLCRHKRMHADCRQQIKCKDCGQAFSTVTSLSKHKRFCEGVMRNGMRGIYPPDKLSPISLSPNGQASHLNPSLFSSIYAAAAARPPFPFSPYHPFGAFSGMLPQGLPTILGSSAVSPSSALKFASNLQQLSPDKRLNLSPEPGSVDYKMPRFSSSFDKAMVPSSDDTEVKNDPSSDQSDASDLDINNVSDNESSDRPPSRKRKFEDSISTSREASPSAEDKERVLKPDMPTEPVEKKPHKETCIAPPGFTQFRPQSPIVSSRVEATSTPIKQEAPYDFSSHGLSKPSETVLASIHHDVEKSTTPEKSQKEDAPLDLSKKPIKPTPILPPESSRKTHIYGELTMSPAPTSLSTPSPASSVAPCLSSSLSLSIPSVSIPDSKSSVSSLYNYPFNPLMMESFLRIKEDLKLQHEVASKFSSPFPRYPMTGPTTFPGLHSHQFSMLPRPDIDKVLSPMIKMEKSAEYSAHHHHHPHHPQQHGHHYGAPGAPGKSKERYACKFCGKVFPRSANLTRHLRTHTGEQPYKCKYCERSFSISSNLQRHVRNIHNKEKPFKCQLCDRCFGQQTNLDRHLKKHETDVSGALKDEVSSSDEADINVDNDLDASEDEEIGTPSHSP